MFEWMCNRRRRLGLLTVLVAMVFSFDSHAACKKVPLGGNKRAAYFPTMAKRMAAAHGVVMKKLVQKGRYAGSGFTIVWYRFGTNKEVEDATGIQISDDPAPGAVTGLLFMGSHSPTNLARMRTLTAATVSYFAHVDEKNSRGRNSI